MSYRRCRKDRHGVGAILSSTKGSNEMNRFAPFVSCLHADASGHQRSADFGFDSGLAAASQASADLLFAVTALILIVGVVLIALSFCKHHA